MGLVRMLHARRERDSRWERTPVPLATDAPVVRVQGADPDRVLLIGSGPAAGVGVDSHQEGLAGALARALTARSGRGAEVEAVGRPFLRTSAVDQVVRSTRFVRFDVVVLMVGMFEALDLVGPSWWEAQLVALVDRLRVAGAADLRVVLVGMPPPSSVGAATRARARRVDRRARALNRVSAAVARSLPRTTFVAVRGPDSPSTPKEEWYARLAEAIADGAEPAPGPVTAGARG